MSRTINGVSITRHTNSIIRANRARTGPAYFFTKETMEHWNSVIEPVVYGERYFVTSEAYDGDERTWSVREVLDDGDILTVGERHVDVDSARKAAQRLADGL